MCVYEREREREREGERERDLRSGLLNLFFGLGLGHLLLFPPLTNGDDGNQQDHLYHNPNEGPHRGKLVCKK